MKYMTKPAIDSLFQRLGDGMAALTVLVGMQVLDLPTRDLALVNVALVACWLGAAVVIVLDYRRLMAAGAPAPSPETRDSSADSARAVAAPADSST
jgi:AAA family ATP:ADP antiporter